MKTFMNEGFDAQTSGESLSSISDSLRRIERKLEDFAVNQISIHPLPIDSHEIFAKLTPSEVFMYALQQGDIDLAAQAFNRLFPQINENEDVATLLTYCAHVASRSELASKIIEENILNTDMLNDADIKWALAFQSLILFWTSHDLAKEKLPKAIEIENLLLQNVNEVEDKARIKQAMGNLYYNLDMHEESYQYCEEVILLSPEDVSYWYNLAFLCIQEDINKLDRAEEAINKMIEIGTDDEDHLKLAIKIYKTKNRNNDVDKLLMHLRRINPYKATLVESELI